MAPCDEFYKQRDRRTSEYLGAAIGDLVPVHLAIDVPGSRSEAGQLALLALANQVARTSRRITFALGDPDALMLVHGYDVEARFADVLLATVRAIDPCGDFTLGERPSRRSVSLGLGSEVGLGHDWYLGADRSLAFISKSPAAFSDWPGTLRGAALVSCLGAAAALREQLGRPVAPRTLSAWNYAEGETAALGPDNLIPLNVGRVLMVGAGAVGSAVAYWLHAFGVRGDEWAIVDGDKVELHNTNRGLAFLPMHAGWPNGRPVNKASVVAPLIVGATPHPSWFHDSLELKEQRFDVILALANDYEVRERLTSQYAAVSLQATTGENWLSQLHRHVLGTDGCIWCRTGEVKKVRFECATAAIEDTNGTTSDAALPFLSAASGLMLVTALQRLSEGSLAGDAANCWSWDFDSQHRMTATPAARQCKDACPFRTTRQKRSRLVAGTRWAALVP